MPFRSALLASASLILLTSCGGGGGGGTSGGTQSDSPFTKTYMASAAAGEVISYTYDSVNRSYSYQMVRSAYGIPAGTTGNGTLTANGDGSYSPSEAPLSKVYAVSNGSLTGAVQISLNGTNRTIPIYGLADPLTRPGSQVADFAGTYNYISLQCAVKNNGLFTGCATNYGTLIITATAATTGTYQMCVSGYASGGVACGTTVLGTIAYSGTSGVWNFKNTATNQDSSLLIHADANGQRVGVLDFDDSGGHGFGQAVIVQQQSTSAAQVGGTYVYQATLPNEANLNAGTFAFNSTNSTGRTGLTYAMNSPWSGMVRTGANGYAIFTAGGAYVYRNPGVASGYYEIGVRRNY